MLEVEDLTVVDPRGVQVVDDVSFEVRGGEILGIAGVQGNGQTELIEALLGLVEPRRRRDHARRQGHHASTARARASRDGHRLHPRGPPPRRAVGAFTVAENLVLDLYRDERVRRAASRCDLDAIEAERRRTGSRSSTSAPSRSSTAVGSLSGGNQQKVVVARELSRPLKLLIAAQPTRGLDVGSIEFIHKRIVAERDNGAAVLIVSTELDEIFALADRIAVMYDGRIVGTVTARHRPRGDRPADGRRTRPRRGSRGSQMSTEPRTQAAPEPEDVQKPPAAEQTQPTRRPIAAADWHPDGQDHGRRVRARAGRRRRPDRRRRPGRARDAALLLRLPVGLLLRGRRTPSASPTGRCSPALGRAPPARDRAPRWCARRR